ncbi:rhodanese-like domain-containing protein [Ichthyenterobacterium magnum]|uniref:Rhodanese-related sulfurtransferase n=1 Tax=Ichthyenterobacterium magnum TaxID=1230530 RepID=A0A420DW13_9FLAO|nr:rhodanese-like domain-containing protein [Ichthyenterobacterium magnum]RKE98405.1 rhodanese-related sulfurtransferase [Ichthyenterobacterium magnum]
MKKILLYFLVSFSTFGFSQESLSELLKEFNEESIPYITVQELVVPKTKVILLDAREENEFNASHLKDAIFVGYDNFEIETVTNFIKDKSTKIVVYCSLGIRSEDIAEKLKAEGYTNVFNLYGGIFEWKNNNFKIYDIDNNETENIHAFSEEWSKWLTKGTKVYE